MSPSYDFWLGNELVLVGSPETLIRQLKGQHQRLGYDVFCANHAWARCPRSSH